MLFHGNFIVSFHLVTAFLFVCLVFVASVCAVLIFFYHGMCSSDSSRIEYL